MSEETKVTDGQQVLLDFFAHNQMSDGYTVTERANLRMLPIYRQINGKYRALVEEKNSSKGFMSSMFQASDDSEAKQADKFFIVASSGGPSYSSLVDDDTEAEAEAAKDKDESDKERFSRLLAPQPKAKVAALLADMGVEKLSESGMIEQVCYTRM